MVKEALTRAGGSFDKRQTAHRELCNAVSAHVFARLLLRCLCGKPCLSNFESRVRMSEFAQRRVTMVDSQVRPSDVTKFPIIAAMLAIPREAFVPAGREEAAYMGDNLDIAPGRVMLEPRTLAKMLDALDLQPEERVMDLGTGLGYAAAVLAEMVAEVVAVEENPALAAEARRCLAAVRNVSLHTGPLTAGAAGLFDVIILQGGVEQVPGAILDQLKDHGRIAAVFMSGALGTVRIGHKADGRVTWRFAFNASCPILPGFSTGRGFVL